MERGGDKVVFLELVMEDGLELMGVNFGDGDEGK